MKYYVSLDGNDANPGTLTRPIKTLQRVQALLSGGGIRGGDEIMLRGGDIFYGRLDFQSRAGSPRIRLTSYGTGKATMCGYRIVSTWSDEGGGVWAASLAAGNSWQSGWTELDFTGVGFLVDSSDSLHGVLRTEQAALSDEYDFYYDSTAKRIFVKCSTNPGTLKISPRFTAIQVVRNLTVENIRIEGYGSHGIRGQGGGNVSVLDNEIARIGGALFGEPTHPEGTRYGNGVEIWIANRDWLVTGNRITECYDAAVTMQGSSNDYGWSNVVIKNNFIDRCDQSFELWTGGTGPGFENCEFAFNVCHNAGYGWSNELRPQVGGHYGVHVLTYGLEQPMSGLAVHNNVFFRAKDAYQRVSALPTWEQRDNTVILETDKPLVWEAGSGRESIMTADEWVSYSGLDIGSTFIPLYDDVETAGQGFATLAAHVAAASHLPVPTDQINEYAGSHPTGWGGVPSGPATSNSTVGRATLLRMRVADSVKYIDHLAYCLSAADPGFTVATALYVGSGQQGLSRVTSVAESTPTATTPIRSFSSLVTSEDVWVGIKIVSRSGSAGGMQVTRTPDPKITANDQFAAMMAPPSGFSVTDLLEFIPPSGLTPTNEVFIGAVNFVNW